MKFSSITEIKADEAHKAGYQIDGTLNLYGATSNRVVAFLCSSWVIGRIALRILGYLGYIELSGTDVTSKENPQPQKVIFVKKSSFYNQVADYIKDRYSCEVCFSEAVVFRVIDTLGQAQVVEERKKGKDYIPPRDFLSECRRDFWSKMNEVRLEPVKKLFQEVDVRGGCDDPDKLHRDEDKHYKLEELSTLITADSFPEDEACRFGYLEDYRSFVAIRDKAGTISFMYETGPAIWKVKRPGVEADGLLSDPEVTAYVKAALGTKNAK